MRKQTGSPLHEACYRNSCVNKHSDRTIFRHNVIRRIYSSINGGDRVRKQRADTELDITHHARGGLFISIFEPLPCTAAIRSGQICPRQSWSWNQRRVFPPVFISDVDSRRSDGPSRPTGLAIVSGVVYNRALTRGHELEEGRWRGAASMEGGMRLIVERSIRPQLPYSGLPPWTEQR